MSDDFGSDYITIVDDDGQESELEVVDSIEYKDQTFTLFLPADLSEDDPDYGFIILKCTEVNGEEMLDSVDDEELLEKVYAVYMEELFEDDEDDAEAPD